MNKQPRPVRIPDLIDRKNRGPKIAMLTAYDATMARLLDCAGIDVILVGDSLGMVVLGYETTIPVTLDAMLHHSRAVSNGAERALVVADMPFLTYQASIPDAVRNAGRLIQEGGAAAVKLEGGRAIAGVVSRLVEIGIPVMGHLGLTPQSVHQLGGFRRVGKSCREAELVIEGRAPPPAAGVFAVVLESIPPETAKTDHRASCPSPPSASAPDLTATARCWSATMFSACSRTSPLLSSNAMPISAEPF